MPISSDGVITATMISPSVSLSIDFSGVGGTSTGFYITVTRLAGGVTQTVRSLDTVVAVGGFVEGFDHEAPLGVPVVYTATISNLAGTLLATSATVTTNIDRPVTGDWLKSITSPALSVQLTTKTLVDWTFGVNQGIFYGLGQAPPVVVSDVRQYPAGTLTVITLGQSDYTPLLTLLSSNGPFLYQAAQSSVFEPDRYVTVGPFTVKRPGRLATDADREYSAPITAVARPATLGATLAIPGHTYAGITASTYAAWTFPATYKVA